MRSDTAPRVIISSGEPAGIGPELVLKLAKQSLKLKLACTGDPDFLDDLSQQLGLYLNIKRIAGSTEIPYHEAGTLHVVPCRLRQSVTPGTLNQQNAAYVLQCLDAAITMCREGYADALTTAPLQKSVINEAGISFSGHTEYLAEQTTAGVRPVMLLASEKLRIALVTTHMSLRQVPDQVSREHVLHTIKTVALALQNDFGIDHPAIAVCGLNPHAGENGHFGREEIDAIEPAIADSRTDNINVDGPLPADTAFTPANREKYDCFIAMFHDQGLPVIKALEFGEIVNVTLGLPIIRTSVDHGTALDIAGKGIADPASLLAAVNSAAYFAKHKTF